MHERARQTHRAPQSTPALWGAGRDRLLLDDFQVDIELHIVADNCTRKLGPDAEGAAANYRGGRETGVRLVIHARLRAARTVCGEDHWLGDAVQRQVAVDRQTVPGFGHAGASEGGCGVGGDIEEVRALEVVVAGLFAGVYAATSMVAFTVDFETSASLKLMVAVTWPNRP